MNSKLLVNHSFQIRAMLSNVDYEKHLTLMTIFCFYFVFLDKNLVIGALNISFI